MNYAELKHKGPPIWHLSERLSKAEMQRCCGCIGNCWHCPYDPTPEGKDEGVEKAFAK